MMEPTKKVGETALQGIIIGVNLCVAVVQFVNGSILFGILFLVIALFYIIMIINTLYRFENYQINILVLIESLIDKITNHNEVQTNMILSALAGLIGKSELRMEDVVSKVVHKVLSEDEVK